MPTMIEKVAEAIYREMTFGNNLNDTEQELKDHYHKVAKAAIEVMREPTNVMINLQYDVKAYQAMIDAALEE